MHLWRYVFDASRILTTIITCLRFVYTSHTVPKGSVNLNPQPLPSKLLEYEQTKYGHHLLIIIGGPPEMSTISVGTCPKFLLANRTSVQVMVLVQMFHKEYCSSAVHGFTWRWKLIYTVICSKHYIKPDRPSFQFPSGCILFWEERRGKWVIYSRAYSGGCLVVFRQDFTQKRYIVGLAPQQKRQRKHMWKWDE